MKHVADALSDYLDDVWNNPASASLNIEQLPEEFQDLGKKLEYFVACFSDEFSIKQKKKVSLEQSNHLFSALVQHVAQQILVVDRDTRKILFMNTVAQREVDNDANYIENIIQILSEHENLYDGREIDIKYVQGRCERFFSVRSYLLELNQSNAEVFVISDLSAAKSKIKELEASAYLDCITQLYNRSVGMLMLDSWLKEKKKFSLVFADLDNLKYVNDKFGHNEGDRYILNAARHLKTFSPDAATCRIGGDEFMILAPDIGYDEAHESMSAVYKSFEDDVFLKGKKYSYSISFGIVAVEPDNQLPASDILSMADERMYKHKRMRKKERQRQAK